MEFVVTNSLQGRTTTVGETQDGKQMVLAAGTVQVSIDWKTFIVIYGHGSVVTTTIQHTVHVGQTVTLPQPSNMEYSTGTLTVLVTAPGNELASALAPPVSLVEGQRCTCVVEYRVALDSDSAFYLMTISKQGGPAVGEEFPGRECQRTPGG